MVESINTQIKDLTISEGGDTEKQGSGLPTVLIVLGMAGSGKTTFVQVSDIGFIMKIPLETDIYVEHGWKEDLQHQLGPGRA